MRAATPSYAGYRGARAAAATPGKTQARHVRAARGTPLCPPGTLRRPAARSLACGTGALPAGARPPTQRRLQRQSATNPPRKNRQTRRGQVRGVRGRPSSGPWQAQLHTRRGIIWACTVFGVGIIVLRSERKGKRTHGVGHPRPERGGTILLLAAVGVVRMRRRTHRGSECVGLDALSFSLLRSRPVPPQLAATLFGTKAPVVFEGRAQRLRCTLPSATQQSRLPARNPPPAATGSVEECG